MAMSGMRDAPPEAIGEPVAVLYRVSAVERAAQPVLPRRCSSRRSRLESIKTIDVIVSIKG